MNERYRCECGWEGSEDELHDVCTFHGTPLEPAEYESYCPDCGANWEDMVEVDLCESCEDELAILDSNHCGGCAVDAAEYILDNR